MGWLPGPGIWLALILQAGAGVCIFPLCFAVMAMVTTPQIRPVAVSVVVPLAHFLGSGLVPFGIGILAETGRFNLGFMLLGGFTLLSLPLFGMFIIDD
jgi:NNP family nitrate/nitrite transporter-like MFS transporter